MGIEPGSGGTAGVEAGEKVYRNIGLVGKVDSMSLDGRGVSGIVRRGWW